MPQVPKPSYKRFKPTAKQRGAINPSVRTRLTERSGGVCERCHSARAVHAAHTVRRWKLKETTLDVLIHLCVECHIWCDNTPEGRKFLSEWNEVRE